MLDASDLSRMAEAPPGRARDPGGGTLQGSEKGRKWRGGAMAYSSTKTKGGLTGEAAPPPVTETQRPPEPHKASTGRRTSPFDEDHEQAAGAGAAEAAQPVTEVPQGGEGSQPKAGPKGANKWRRDDTGKAAESRGHGPTGEGTPKTSRAKGSRGLAPVGKLVGARAGAG